MPFSHSFVATYFISWNKVQSNRYNQEDPHPDKRTQRNGRIPFLLTKNIAENYTYKAFYRLTAAIYLMSILLQYQLDVMPSLLCQIKCLIWLCSFFMWLDETFTVIQWSITGLHAKIHWCSLVKLYVLHAKKSPQDLQQKMGMPPAWKFGDCCSDWTHTISSSWKAGYKPNIPKTQ